MANSKMNQDDGGHKVICYVGKDGMTVLECPECETGKTIDTNDKDYAFRTFKARCKCGASFRGQFEFRRYYRKKVCLSGLYKHCETGIGGKITVENISLEGVGFCYFGKHHFQKGDQLDITFNLDNPMKSKIKFRVEVQHIKGRFIGVKRCDILSMQPELGFYLR